MEQAKELEKAVGSLFVREQALGEALTGLAEAKLAYKLKYSAEFLKASGTVKEKEALADRNCEREYHAFLAAEAVADYVKHQIHDCRAAIEARRSLLSNERSERESGLTWEDKFNSIQAQVNELQRRGE